MKKNVLTFCLALLLGAMAQPLNAQFLKQLGKFVGEVGKALLETPSDNTAQGLVNIVFG